MEGITSFTELPAFIIMTQGVFCGSGILGRFHWFYPYHVNRKFFQKTRWFLRGEERNSRGFFSLSLSFHTSQVGIEKWMVDIGKERCRLQSVGGRSSGIWIYLRGNHQDLIQRDHSCFWNSSGSWVDGSVTALLCAMPCLERCSCCRPCVINIYLGQVGLLRNIICGWLGAVLVLDLHMSLATCHDIMRVQGPSGF